jgi:serine/threonine-protein kinase
MAGEHPSQSTVKSLPRIGSYELLQPLGSGGMSSVFRARHTDTGLEVAVKVLPRTLARNPTVLQRFLREAKSAESLEHPNIVAIYDRGIDQGRHYLVLEYVAGGDFHDKVRSQGPLPIHEAIAVVRAVAEGLQFAAGRGLIHRDIKPANLLLSSSGQVKIADLGLALQAEEEDERVTREGTTVGTVDYMAPEQARDSRATSVRSDIYSLGCTLFFLLTGQPPFPGGDVAEKLHRHINVTAPDIRESRPEVPEALARVIATMLAKRPESRFGSYDALIAALDGVSAPGPQPGAAEPLYALFDDDDEDEIGLVPDDDGLVPLTPAAPPAPRGPGERPGSRPASGPILMAELAALDEPDDHLALPAPRPTRALPARPGAAPQEPLVALIVDDEEEGDEPGHELIEPLGRSMPAAMPSSSARGMSASEKSWLVKCVLAGVGLVLLVIAINEIVHATRTSGPVLPQPESDAPHEVEHAVVPQPDLAVAVARPKADIPKPIVQPRPKPEPKPVSKPVPPSWKEPEDPAPEVVAEPDLGPGVEARFLPDWATSRGASAPPGKPVIVRRIPDAREPDQRSTLQSALEARGAETVELADNGPFFVDSLTFVGESRVIRARPGYRPVVAFERPWNDSAPARPALVDLADKSLVLEGLDLVIDPGSLGPTQSAVFLCRGGALTLRDCTVTLALGRTMVPFSLVKTAAGREKSRVLFERTYVRGSCSSVVEVSAGLSDVVISRSVVLNGQGVGVSFTASGAGKRGQVSVVRAVMVTGRAAFELADTPPGEKPRPVAVRALGSTFARFRSPMAASLVAARFEAGAPTDLVDWLGDANTFAGWSGWLSTGAGRAVRVPDLSAARATWPRSDAGSDESPAPWPPLPPSPDQVVPAQLRPYVPSRLSVLARVPTPGLWLLARTVHPFPAVHVPDGIGGEPVAEPFGQGSQARRSGKLQVAPTSPNRLVAAPQAVDNRMPAAPGAGGQGPSSRPDPAAAWPGFRELAFDAEAPEDAGDLGRFLARSIKADDTLVRVRVKGANPHACSPFRLPDGVSLDVEVVADELGRSPSWSAVPFSSADALIDAHRGSLRLSGVRLSRDGTAGLKWLVRVEGGHLVLNGCRLTAAGAVETGGGGLVGFFAPSTQELRRPAPSHWPFETPADRLTCLITDGILLTPGVALTAEVGRGLVALSDCVVVSGDAAFSLRPGRVARDRLNADLWLSHCSVAAERSAVAFGPWRGNDPGPDRPWLVSTVGCAFFGQYDRPAQESVLLRADAEAFAHGAVFWQASGDLAEVAHLAATGDATPPVQSRRSDARAGWAALWGVKHAFGISGPRPGGPGTTRLRGKLRPGRVVPADLAIVDQGGRRTGDFGADLSRLGITPGLSGGSFR